MIGSQSIIWRPFLALVQVKAPNNIHDGGSPEGLIPDFIMWAY